MERAEALRALGEQVRRSDLAMAEAHYREAIALFRGCDAPLRLAHTIRHLGDVLMQAGAWADADACLGEALALYRSNPSAGRLDVANAIRSRALLEEHLGRRGEAVALWTEARDLYELEGIAEGVKEARRHADRERPGAG